MENPFEPPRTHSPLPVAALVDTFPFDVHLGKGDVHVGAFRFVFILAAIMPFALLAIARVALAPFRGGGIGLVSWLQILIGVALPCAFCGYLLWRYLTAAQRVIESYPLAFSHLQGEISPQGIFIQSDHDASFHPMTSLRNAEVRGRVLAFTFDRNHLVRYYLPERAFIRGGFDQVASFMTAFAKSRPAGDLLDPRLIDEQNLLPLEISPDAIRVFGALTMKDLRASDLKRNIQTAKRRLFLWMLTFNSVAAVVLYFLYFNDAGRLPQFMIAGAVIWFNLRILNRMRYALGTKYDEDQILLKLHGGISADGIQMASTVGTTQYAWSAFVSVAQEADIVSLRLQGTQGHNVVLTRRMFSSDEDWQRAMKTFENIDGRIQNNVG